MEKEDLEIFEENVWLFLRLKTGHHYKGQIIKLSDVSVTIRDRFEEIVIIDLQALDFVKEWAEKRNIGESRWA